MITALQKKTAQAIVNIFESGQPQGDYGRVTVLKGDTGHLTYGCRQTTLGSGNLALLIHDYCDANGLYSEDLRPFLSRFNLRDFSLDQNETVKSLLRQAGDDPVMRRVQDQFFDRIYWAPAVKSAENIGIAKPLSLTVIYDSKIHGSYDRVRNVTDQQYGPAGEVGEEAWIEAYVGVRRNWLASHANALLHKTVYRMDAFGGLIRAGKWELPLPLTVRHMVITEELLSAASSAMLTAGIEPSISSAMLTADVVSAADVDERVLFLAEPMMEGEDVRRLQKALGFTGPDMDGVFGSNTDRAVRNFQKAHGLKVDGKAGPATRAELSYNT